MAVNAYLLTDAEWHMGRSALIINYPEPFLSGSGDEARQQVAAVPIPLDGIGLGAAGNRSTEYGYTQNPHNVKIEIKIQLVEVLEGLEIGLQAIQFSLHFKKFPK